MIYVTVSTGVGGGVVLDGRLQRGPAGEHPEIGHHVVDPAGPACFCGAHGCWESLASSRALATWAASQAGGPDGDAQWICELARAGEPLAQQAVAREAYYLGLGLANIILLLVPEGIVLGGGVMQEYDLFAPGIRAVVDRHSIMVPASRVKIVKSMLGVQSGVLGAARAAMNLIEEHNP